jgi:hypothetical protein
MCPLTTFAENTTCELIEMKQFEQRQIREAREYSIQGGQALHLHRFNQGHPLFRRYPVIAHLFDQNKERLVQTAKSLGVRVIKVEREGEDGQHIDLCGKPLERAQQRCEQ